MILTGIILCIFTQASAATKVHANLRKDGIKKSVQILGVFETQKNKYKPIKIDKKIRETNFEKLRQMVGPEYKVFTGITLPNIEGYNYGWAIKLNSKEKLKSIKIKQVITAPKEITWNTYSKSGDLIKSDFSKIYITEKELEVDGGWVYSGLSLGPGEPSGPYNFKLSYENETVVEFDFFILDEAEFIAAT